MTTYEIDIQLEPSTYNIDLVTPFVKIGLIGDAPSDGTTYGRKNASWNALAAVAVSGNYGDLSGTPDLSAVALSGSYDDLSGTPSLAAVALSGNYSDLSGTPDLSVYVEKDLMGYTEIDYDTIDDRDKFYLDKYPSPNPRHVRWGSLKRNLLNYFNTIYAKISNLADIAFSGSYTDLSNKPDLTAKQDNYTTQSITIAVADWSGGTTATKTVTGVTATSYNSVTANKTNADLLAAFGVWANAQSTDEITFTADETPTEDISVTIVIFS